MEKLNDIDKEIQAQTSFGKFKDKVTETKKEKGAIIKGNVKEKLKKKRMRQDNRRKSSHISYKNFSLKSFSLSLSLCIYQGKAMCGHIDKVTIYKPGKDSSPGTSLIMDFQPP
jgi:hypothetical protein